MIHKTNIIIHRKIKPQQPKIFTMIQINYNYQIDPKKQTSPHIYKNFERNLFTSKTWLKKLKQTDIDLDKESTLIGV